MLSSLVIIFLPRSKCLLISWLQSISAVIWEPPKIKSVTVSVKQCTKATQPTSGGGRAAETGSLLIVLVNKYPDTGDADMLVLEKTLESPLDSKEIKPVNPKVNQS